VSRSVKLRLVIFLVLAVAGIGNVSFSYLGLGDWLLGRGITVTASLPDSGGLYTGGDVTVRGVRVGEIGDMTPTAEGVDVELKLNGEVDIPQASPFQVHNGSAVGEQYLDFSPPGSEGPFLQDGDRIVGDSSSLPIAEADLLLQLDEFVESVDTRHVRTVVNELGLMFAGAGRPLQEILAGTNALLDEATTHQEATIGLLNNAETVLATQQRGATNIRRFADGFARIAEALRRSDGSLRTLFSDGPVAFAEIEGLLSDLQPILPTLLNNVASVTEVLAVQIPAVEQLLVVLPVTIAGAFSGTTADGYGNVGVQFDYSAPPCSRGYLPLDQRRPASDLDDPPDQDAYDRVGCDEPRPVNPRGTKWAPRPHDGLPRVAPFDPERGILDTSVGAIEVLDASGGARYGEEAWKWMLTGPVKDGW
jgi:phospholipid/cholesterol/gamma-HCH transport system substrate-binding protein